MRYSKFTFPFIVMNTPSHPPVIKNRRKQKHFFCNPCSISMNPIIIDRLTDMQNCISICSNSIVQLVNSITPVATVQGTDNYTVTVRIVSGLEVTAAASTDNNFVKNGQVSDKSPAFVTVKNPYNEPFDQADIKITFDERYTGSPYAIQSSLVEESSDTQTGTVYGFRIQPLYVGVAGYTVTYQNTQLTNGRITISKEEQLSAGWTWLALSTTGGNVSELFKSDLVEIRSQKHLMFYDQAYGYVGTLTVLNPEDAMYKVKTSKAAKVNLGSNVVISPVAVQQKTIKKGYNWVNYPYEFDLPLNRIAEIYAGSFKPAYGDVIIMQDGFAIFDEATGDWASTTNFSLKEGKGFMYFSKDDSEKQFVFDPSLEPAANGQIPYVPGPTEPSNPVKAFANNVVDNILQYDVHAFADNMSMVAEIQGLDNPEDYTLGAFVDDECRGRGSVAVDGKMFVSAVGTSGEYVTFKLVNNHTGKVIPVEGTVSFSQMQGTLRAPVKLHTSIATSIDKTEGTAQTAEAYDLSGRRIAGNQRGVSIQRMADGSVRKVVKN